MAAPVPAAPTAFTTTGPDGQLLVVPYTVTAVPSKDFYSSLVDVLVTAVPNSILLSLATVPIASQTEAVLSLLYPASGGYPSWISAVPAQFFSAVTQFDPRKVVTATIVTGGRTYEVSYTIYTAAGPVETSTRRNSTSPISSTSSRSGSLPLPTTSTPRQSSSAGPTSTTPSIPPNGGSSAPVGAIVGGVIGGLAVVIMGLFLLLAFKRGWFAKDKKKEEEEEKGEASKDNAWGKPELEATTKTLSELQGTRDAAELEGQRGVLVRPPVNAHPAELPAEEVQR